MSELHLYVVQGSNFWTFCYMMSVMHEIEDYVLDSPITLTMPTMTNKLVENIRTGRDGRARPCNRLQARQQYHLQLVELYQPHIVQVSERQSPKSPSDSTEEWDDAQTICAGTSVRMWHTTPLSPWRSNLSNNCYKTGRDKNA